MLCFGCRDGRPVSLNAPDSKAHHLGHARACLGILLDAMANGCLEDDRPTPKDRKLMSKLLADLAKRYAMAHK